MTPDRIEAIKARAHRAVEGFEQLGDGIPGEEWERGPWRLISDVLGNDLFEAINEVERLRASLDRAESDVMMIDGIESTAWNARIKIMTLRNLERARRGEAALPFGEALADADARLAAPLTAMDAT